jgi:sialidase-1
MIAVEKKSGAAVCGAAGGAVAMRVRGILFAAIAGAAWLGACSGGGGGADAGGDGVADAGPDGGGLAGYDCAFALSDGPFVIGDAISGHAAFPDVARLPTGELLLVYRDATEHGVDPAGRIVRQVGSADGLTWGGAEVLHDTPGIDDRDPSVAVTADGEVLLNWFQYVYQATDDGDLSVHQIFFGRSDDLGATLTEVAMVPADGAMEYPGAHIDSESALWVDTDGAPIEVTAVSSPIRVVGGAWLIQAYGGESWNTSNPASPRSRISLFESADEGATWEERIIADGEGENTWLQEPSLLALDGDRLLVQARTAAGTSPGNAGNLWQTRSDDGGQTWSAYEDLGFIGQAPYLYRLSNGVIVSAFRWLNSAMTSTDVQFIYSLDEGATWSEMISILGPQITEVGYPSILELEGDRMLIVFYVGGASIQGAIYDFALVESP